MKSEDEVVSLNAIATARRNVSCAISYTGIEPERSRDVTTCMTDLRSWEFYVSVSAHLTCCRCAVIIITVDLFNGRKGGLVNVWRITCYTHFRNVSALFTWSYQ